jgi:UDP-glucose 4-epimerase
MSVLQACQQTGVKKFVFSSTAAVYGDAGSDLITEDLPIKAINPYGNSKYFSECIIRDCEKAFGIKNVVLRYFNVAGAAHDISNGQRSKISTHLIKLAAETALGVNPYLKMTGTDFPTKDGTGIRDYIHVEDLADLHTLAFEYLENDGKSDIFNCGYGHGYSVREVVDTMKKVSGIDFKVVETERRPGDAASLVAGNEKIKRTFNWTPKRNNLELICRSAFEWESVWQKRLKELNERKLREKHAGENTAERPFQPSA